MHCLASKLQDVSWLARLPVEMQPDLVENILLLSMEYDKYIYITRRG